MGNARTIKVPTTGMFDFARLVTSAKGLEGLVKDLCHEAGCEYDDGKTTSGNFDLFLRAAAAKKTLLSWYDGYRFSPQSEAKVCNPVSLGNALESGELKNYWEATGQATIVVNRIKAAKEIPADLNGMAATRTQLDACAA